MAERVAARRAAVAAATLAIVLPLAPTADAQDTARVGPGAPPAALGLEPGRRVRVQLGDYRGRVAGVIDSVLATAFVLDTAASGPSLPFMARGPELLTPYRVMRVEYGEIERLEVSRGSSRARGAILWGLVGGGAGALLTGLNDGGSVLNEDDGGFASRAISGAIVGAVLGGTLGYFTGRERWTPVGWP